MLKEVLSILNFIYSHPLSKGHKIKAFENFIRWQIGLGVLNKKIIAPWVDEARFIAGKGETGLTGNIYSGLMEYEGMVFLLHAIQPNEIFVDVGANVGAYTILASKVANARSIAFEPIPETFERLLDQIHLNRIEHMVDLKNMGVGDTNKMLCFTANRDTTNRVCIDSSTQNTTNVEVTTLDCALNKDESYFLKIDVEGYEYNVLRGSRDILSSSRVSALIIELNGSGLECGHSNEDIHNMLLEFNFKPISYEPKLRKLFELKSFKKNGGNTIYVKDIDLMQIRCLEAPRRQIHTAAGVYL